MEQEIVRTKNIIMKIIQGFEIRGWIVGANDVIQAGLVKDRAWLASLN